MLGDRNLTISAAVWKSPLAVEPTQHAAVGLGDGAAARSVGLTSQQHQALLAIRGFPEPSITVGQLAQQVQVAHHTAVELVDRLRLQKFVARETRISDRRSVCVNSPKTGWQLLKTLTWGSLR
jgi:DNA-binding MarR family transcriptional regulator